MTNILYIHGKKRSDSPTSTTADTLQKALGDNFRVVQVQFPVDVDASVALAKEIIEREDIKLVVASSLGGFTALLLRGYSDDSNKSLPAPVARTSETVRD